MSEPFIGEIQMFGGNFAPRGWARCDGQLLPVQQNDALFSLVGTHYGGDGRTTFALPDLRGRVPVHQDSAHSLGHNGGGESVTLTKDNLPSHTHAAQAGVAQAAVDVPTDALYGPAATSHYAPKSNLVAMNSGMVKNAGGGKLHNNMAPFLAINYIIALTGVYPSRH